MSLCLFSKVHKFVLIKREHIDLCVFPATILGMQCPWLTAFSHGKVASLIAVNGDSICSHYFLQLAFWSVIIILKKLILIVSSLVNNKENSAAYFELERSEVKLSWKDTILAKIYLCLLQLREYKLNFNNKDLPAIPYIGHEMKKRRKERKKKSESLIFFFTVGVFFPSMILCIYE